jgi:hypothetical protein
MYQKFQDYAGVAQTVERLICNQDVGGSIPLSSTSFNASVAEMD